MAPITACTTPSTPPNTSGITGTSSGSNGAEYDPTIPLANFGPALSLPLFDGGARSGRYHAASAGREEAVARYNNTLLGAVREVADALTSKRAIVSELQSARTAAAASNLGAKLARQRFAAGLINRLALLAAEDTALVAQRAVVALEARAFGTDIALVKALGGGFSADAPSEKSVQP